jgi:hypothetical protein
MQLEVEYYLATCQSSVDTLLVLLLKSSPLRGALCVQSKTFHPVKYILIQNFRLSVCLNCPFTFRFVNKYFVCIRPYSACPIFVKFEVLMVASAEGS